MAAQPDPPKTAAKPPKPGDSKAPADPKAAAASTTKPPRNRGKLLWAFAVLVILAAGGAGAFAFLSASESAETAGTEAAAEQPGVFVPLETFTVNLLPSEGLQQYLQTNVTLKVASQTTADAVKARMPEVRNRVLLILSAKRSPELLPVAGKQKLATEIGEAVHGMLERTKAADAASGNTPAPSAQSAPAAQSTSTSGNGSRPPRSVEVLFTAFIIQ